MQTNLLTPRVNPDFSSGCSLKYAYQPGTDADILTCYNSHPCQACGDRTVAKAVPDSSLLQLGSILFKVLTKPCRCGYVNEMVMGLNTVLRQTDPAIVPVDIAIAEAEATQQLPDPIINESLIAAQVAIHHQQFDRAIAINQALASQYPDLFLPFYNLGVLYAQQQRYQDSVTSYDAALVCHPQHADSLSGKAIAHLQLGQLRQAGATYEQWRHQNPDGIVVLAKMAGLFGTVQVIDTPEYRSLCINQQVQGTVYKVPTATEFEPSCRLGPGALASNRFAAGMLLLNYPMRQASGLVLGLGCGAGLVMNLACFPDLHLTVVEIDPVVIRLCLTFFPLIQHYVDQGRLEIVEADALAFLASNRRRFDFLQFDSYQGKPEVPSPFRSVEVIRQMGATAPLLLSNIIGKLNDPLFHEVLENFDRAGCPLHTLCPARPIKGNESIYLNWLTTTQPLNIPDHFVPFSNLSGDAVDEIRQNFREFRRYAVSRESIRPYSCYTADDQELNFV